MPGSQDTLISLSDATASAYFLYGIEAGLLPLEAAREWAFSLIADRSHPSIQIIEVATADRRETAISCLRAVAPDADLVLAGRLLLATLHDQLRLGQFSLRSSLNMARQITSSTCPDSQAYQDFDLLDDELLLAEHGIYGTVDDVMESSLSVMSEPVMVRS
ncbi:hypothetical protein [Stenotrophomonas sp.]|uniref:hypothetical protein n=1 Tax=Stenotrophomonas sp. TaxID=69392 RepID=UPI0028A6D777|nr:hypothetical protein [Stenotrophomonas sp.]